MDKTNLTNSKNESSQQAKLVAELWARRLPSYDEALSLLNSKGIDTNKTTPEDLNSFDMVHVGGIEATDLVAIEAGIRSGQHILDVGCGLGGPARRFASQQDTLVSAIELSEPVFRTAVALTSLVGLADKITFTLGSALNMPYEEEIFDVVIMQHCAMQVTEKNRMFEECARVLRTGGSLVMHEFFSGSGGDPYYPLAWATEPIMSAVQSFEDTEILLNQLGLDVGPFLDQGNVAISFYSQFVTKLEKAVADGAGYRGKATEEAQNSLRIYNSMLKNFHENRMRLGIVVCRKSTN